MLLRSAGTPPGLTTVAYAFAGCAFFAAAFVFVFIPTIGEFVTPSLVGGTKGTMFGNAIQSLFTSGLDWQTGSVLALFLVGVVAILMAISARALRLRTLETH